jgi:hypothetical protein
VAPDLRKGSCAAGDRGALGHPSSRSNHPSQG